MTPRELHFYAKGYSAMHERRIQESLEWQRIFATIQIRPHLKGDVKPEDLIKFPWEKKRSQPLDLPALKAQLKQLAARTAHG